MTTYLSCHLPYQVNVHSREAALQSPNVEADSKEILLRPHRVPNVASKTIYSFRNQLLPQLLKQSSTVMTRMVKIVEKSLKLLMIW